MCLNVLNESVREDLPLAGIGNFLAMTSNDEVNSLMTREFRGQFGRGHVYQLSFNAKNLSGRRGLTKHLMGRELFDAEAKFTTIRELHRLGAKFKATTLSEEFTYEQYLKQYQDRTTPLIAINGDGKSYTFINGHTLTPKAGWKIIGLIEPERDEADKAV